MANNALGELRRSAAALTFGPGSVVDFRADGAPVSAVAAGLEEWDRSFPPPGLNNPQCISEPRLQRKLSVGGFRLPPVVDETSKDRGMASPEPVPRPRCPRTFPKWLPCSRCDRLAPGRVWGQERGGRIDTVRLVAEGSGSSEGCLPSRLASFIAARKAHLDDFPSACLGRAMKAWLLEAGTSRPASLRPERPGLAGLILSCPECNARRSMLGVFSRRIWRGLGCRGRRPWLATSNEHCDSEPRTLQRGASNLYFPVVTSALSIPPWSDPLQDALGTNWDLIVKATPEARPVVISLLAERLEPALEEIDLGPDELVQHIEERVRRYNDDAILDIRKKKPPVVSDTIRGKERDRNSKRERCVLKVWYFLQPHRPC